MFNCRLTKKDYLKINSFLDLIVMEQEKNPHILERKATRGAISKMVREMAS